MVRLQDLGERRIVEEVLAPRYAAASPRFGDDCATVHLRDNDHLLVTTDPCPPPMSAHLGFPDLYYAGWLLATINLSDLAAAGADPLGLLTSLQLRPQCKFRSWNASSTVWIAVAQRQARWCWVETSKRPLHSTSPPPLLGDAIRYLYRVPGRNPVMRSLSSEISGRFGRGSLASRQDISRARSRSLYLRTS